jgi:hypothetical protein
VAKFTEEDDALLDELGVEVEAKRDTGRTAREERIIAGFEEIQRFVDQHGYAPQHGEDSDVFERVYAVRRVANARLDPTFLMADVEVVATYKLSNINRARLENLIHRIFSPAQLNIEIKDRFGNPVVPREWFLVPRFVIDEAVEKIRNGSISNFRYDPKAASLVEVV